MQTDKPNSQPWRPTVQRTACSLLALVLLAAGAAQASMYRWVDSNGRVHYSDTRPSHYNQSGGSEMNRQGTVIKRTQSEAERRAEAVRQAEQARVQAEQARQAQIDRALMQTYTSEAEIDLARDRALEHHMLAIRSSQLRAEAVNATLADLRGRIASLEKAGRTPGPGLVEQLAQAERESLELRRAVLNREEAMVKVRDRYEADKLRFRELSAALR